LTEYKRRQYTAEFKKEAVELVTRENYTVAQAAHSLGISRSMLDRWRREYREREKDTFPGTGHQAGEAEELKRLREENRKLRLEKEILKKRRHSSPGSPGEVCIRVPSPVRIPDQAELPGTGNQPERLLRVSPKAG
jgi:transposase